ncbi:uncharacterized protein [Solanum lycopersicum]|uniref:uncharacterized protein n=1 Tax=Solanum lycopersicum TaxID=4081 RepID=UPI003748AB9A
MNHFVTGMSDDVVEECCSTMLHDNIDISRLMVHAQQVEESRVKRKNRDAKRASSYEGGTDNCFSCGKSGHKMRDCPNLKSQVTGSGQAQTSGSIDAPKTRCLYALRSRGEKETSPNMVNSMLKVFSLDVYSLLDPSSNLSFVTPLLAKEFDILPDISHEPFIVSTLMAESVVEKGCTEIVL